MKPRYSFRTLLIVMTLVAPLCVYVWPKYLAWREVQLRAQSEAQQQALLEELIRTLNQTNDGTKLSRSRLKAINNE
jgi:type II secretory pathway pseudopilin PulG